MRHPRLPRLVAAILLVPLYRPVRPYWDEASFESETATFLSFMSTQPQTLQMLSMAELGAVQGEPLRMAAAPTVGIAGTSLKCAWPLYITPKTYNCALPDENAIYHAMIVDGITSNAFLRIKGSFPNVRYFSYQTYDPVSGRPIGSRPDFQITPDRPGAANPYASRPQSDAPGTETYTIHVTPLGLRGLPNELPALNSSQPEDVCDTVEGGCRTVIFLRLYMDDPAYDPFKPVAPIVRWGGVQAPTVTRLTVGPGGKVVESTKVDDCTNGVRNVVAVQLSQLQRQKMEAQNPYNGTALDNADNNFMLYMARKYSTPYPNMDSNYMFAPARALEDPWVLMAKITGRLPVIPGGLQKAPYIGDPSSYEVRYVSFSTMNPSSFQPLIDGLTDRDIEDFYTGAPGPKVPPAAALNRPGEGSGTGFVGRAYTIVAGPDRNTALRCGMLEVDKELFLATEPMDLGLRRALKDEPGLLAFVYRQVLSSEQLTGKEDTSISYTKKLCENVGSNACFSQQMYRLVMRENYPNITYYACNRRTWEVVPVKQAVGSTPVPTASKAIEKSSLRGGASSSGEEAASDESMINPLLVWA